MIARLRGKTVARTADGLLIDVEDTLQRHYTFVYETIDNHSYLQSVTDFSSRTVLYSHYGINETGGNPGDLKSVRSPVVTDTPRSIRSLCARSSST